MQNILHKPSVQSTMSSRILWITIFFTFTRGSTENIFRIESPLGRSQNIQRERNGLHPRKFPLLQKAIDTIADDTCRDQCQSILIGMQNLTGWAVKYYDASGKFPTGVLVGSVYQLGNFDECLDLSLDDDAPVGIQGQYCLSEVDVTVPEIYLSENTSIWEAFRDNMERHREPIKKLYWGICVPAKCSAENMENVIRRILAVTFSEFHLKLTVTISEISCYSDQRSETIHTPDIIYMSVISFVLAIILGGTIFHAIYLKNSNETPSETLSQILVSFSLLSNLKKLFGPSRENNLHLDCISGIKFFCMMFIVAGHSLIFIMGGPVLNKTFLEKAVTKAQNAIFLNNPLLVDTFLLLSGFLLCRILLRELDSKKSVNFLLLYIVRYIRLTPVYFVMVGLYVTWLTRLDRGPLWSKMRYEKEKCSVSWWTNLLYINNYVDTDKLCMFQSWYLAVDTQLFVLAPAIIYPLWKWRKIGEYLLIGVTTISIVIPFAMTLLNNLDPTFMIFSREIKDITSNDYFLSSYIKTHMRAESYCVGLACGYIVYRIQIDEHEMSKKIVRFGWLFAILSLIISMFSVTMFYTARKNFTVIEAAIYSPVHRFLWCAGIGWIIIASITDNAGPLRNFLKCRPFVVLSRLTYSAYLINGLVELHSVATMRTPQHVDNFELFRLTLSHIILTFGGAILLSVMFESPILNLQRIFLRSEKRTSKNTSDEGANVSTT